MSTAARVAIGIGIVAALGAGGVGLLRRGRSRGGEVHTAAVARTDIVSHVLANGKLQPRNKVDVSANIAGQIVNLAVREGERVEKGDFLLQIDKAQYQATALSSEANLQSLLHDRDAARARLEQARYDLEKAARSYGDRLIPEAEFERARTALEAGEAGHRAAEGRVEQARAALEGARDSLSKTTIRAPLSGVVTSLPVHEGEVAVIGTMNNPGTVLMTISELASMEADLAVDETDLPRLAVGQPARLTIEAYPDRDFAGVVREVGASPIRPGSDAATRTGSVTAEAIDFEVKVSLVDAPPGIRPGFSVTAEIEAGRSEAVLAVPIQALVTRDAPAPPGGGRGGRPPAPEEGVFRLEGAAARFVAVTVGLTGSLEVEVLGGLQEGDVIITGPFRVLRELKDGDPVRSAPAPAPGRGAG
jgi:HlyD family secretion protein